jgi:uncharacterized protein with ATP-grasp and redox domains
MELQDQLDEQQETIDNAVEVLEEAYTPEASRADLVNAVSQALDILSGEDEEEDENGEDDE